MPSTPVDAWAQRSHRLAAWLSRIALGDRQAFAALYRETSAHLFGVVLRIQPDTARAEDLLQDIYISLWQSAGSFDPQRSQPLTWLTSIARHRAIDSLRRRRGEVRTVSRHVADDEGEEERRDPGEQFHVCGEEALHQLDEHRILDAAEAEAAHLQIREHGADAGDDRHDVQREQE